MSRRSFRRDFCSSDHPFARRDRVGGRSWTRDCGERGKVDLGGVCSVFFAEINSSCAQAYLGPAQNRIIRVARELGVLTQKVYTKGKNIMSLNGRQFSYTGVQCPCSWCSHFIEYR